jgi:hypothetical protein
MGLTGIQNVGTAAHLSNDLIQATGQRELRHPVILTTVWRLHACGINIRVSGTSTPPLSSGHMAFHSPTAITLKKNGFRHRVQIDARKIQASIPIGVKMPKSDNYSPPCNVEVIKLYLPSPIHLRVKDKDKSEGSRRLRLPGFSDNRHMKVVRLLAPVAFIPPPKS